MEQWIGSVHSKMAWQTHFKFGVYRVLEKSSSYNHYEYTVIINKCVLQQGPCKYDPSQRAANCTKYYFVSKGDEEALKQAVANIGPISVAIDATRPQFVFYHSGEHFFPTHFKQTDLGLKLFIFTLTTIIT